jgi:hypothetical protein
MEICEVSLPGDEGKVHVHIVDFTSTYVVVKIPKCDDECDDECDARITYLIVSSFFVP